MTDPGSAEYVYRDKKLGDTTPITLETAPDVFRPTSTSVLLLRAARQLLQQKSAASVLDLGCGCGVVAVVLASVSNGAKVSASDLSAAAATLTLKNAGKNGVSVEARSGSLFEPWAGRRFAMIVDDVAGVAEPLDRLSGWYPGDVPSEAGPDGTRWILEILDQAPNYLEPDGRLVFPVITLAREDTVLARARERFGSVRLLEEQWYPLTEALTPHMPLIERLASEGRVRLQQQGSRTCWATMIYLAEEPVSTIR
jgi:methylase of polypeptide subunit release factors